MTTGTDNYCVLTIFIHCSSRHSIRLLIMGPDILPIPFRNPYPFSHTASPSLPFYSLFLGTGLVQTAVSLVLGGDLLGTRPPFTDSELLLCAAGRILLAARLGVDAVAGTLSFETALLQVLSLGTTFLSDVLVVDICWCGAGIAGLVLEVGAVGGVGRHFG